jgi:hypothetical protein
MKKIVVVFFLLFSLFADAAIIDSAKVAQLITNGNKAFCHILDINAEAVYQNKKENMQFVIEVPGTYVKTETHGAGASLNDVAPAIIDSANAQLRRIYLEYGVELYVIMINSLDVIVNTPLPAGTLTTQNFFHSKLYDSISNVTALKAEHTFITDRIIAQSLSAQNRDCLILSEASYCGAFFPGKNKFCLELEVLSSHTGSATTYPQLSALQESFLSRLRQNYVSTALNSNFSLPESVKEFAEAAKYIKLKGAIRQVFDPGFLDAIFAQFNEEIDYEGLSTADRVHALSVYSGFSMSGDWFGNTGQETYAILIIQRTPPDKVHDLLYYLEQPNSLKGNPNYHGDQSDDALIKKLIDHTDDAAMSADNNYTKLVQVITNLIMSSEQVFAEHLPQTNEEKLNRQIYWNESYLFGPAPIGTHKYNIAFNSNGTLAVQKQIVASWDKNIGNEGISSYEPVWDNSYTPFALQPFDIVYFTNKSNNGMLQAAGITKDKVFLAPAIILQYAKDKTFNSNAIKVGAIALDLIAIASGPGAILAAIESGSVALSAFEVVQFLGSAGNLTMNGINDPELQSIVDKYNMIVGVWGLSHIVASGTKFTVNYFTEAATGELHALPVATAREFETAFQQAGTKINELSPEVRGQVQRMDEYLKGKVGVVNSLVNEVSFTDFANTVEEFKNGANAQLAQQSYNLWKEQKWVELEQLFTTHNFNGGWPPYDGFVSKSLKTLGIGVEFDRYGGEIVNGVFIDKGKFAAPINIQFEARALPELYRTKELRKYRVIKPLPNVNEGNAAPWFNQMGGGNQYQLPLGINDLELQGYIERIL